jgi:hypothetical protein
MRGCARIAKINLFCAWKNHSHYSHNESIRCRLSLPNWVSGRIWLSDPIHYCKEYKISGREDHLPLRYRNHLIIEKATFDASTGSWTVRAHIQYNEHIEFCDVLISGPGEGFKTRKTAHRYIFAKAKEWVNSRLDGLNADHSAKS